MAKEIKTGWISDFKGDCAYAPKTLLDQVLFKDNNNKLIKLSDLINFKNDEKNIIIINPYDNNNKLSLIGSIQIEGDIHLSKENNCLNLNAEIINLNSFKINPKINGNYYKFDISNNNNKSLSIGIGSDLEKVNFSKNGSESILEIGNNSLKFEKDKLWVNGHSIKVEADAHIKSMSLENVDSDLISLNHSEFKINSDKSRQEESFLRLSWTGQDGNYSVVTTNNALLCVGNYANINPYNFPSLVIGTSITYKNASNNLYSVLMGHNIQNCPSGICIGNELNIITKQQDSIQNNVIAIGYNIQGSVEQPSTITEPGLNILIGNNIEGYGIDSIAIGNGAKIGGRNEEDELIYPKQAIQLGQGTNVLGGLQVHGYRLLNSSGQLVINSSAIFHNTDELLEKIKNENIEVGTMFFVLDGYVNE